LVSIGWQEGGGADRDRHVHDDGANYIISGRGRLDYLNGAPSIAAVITYQVGGQSVLATITSRK
jgi:hypothetical protein